MDVSSTGNLSSGDPANPYVFPPSTHVIVGSYLIVVGILGSMGNGLVLLTFLRFRVLLATPTSLLLVNLAASDLGLILFGFPFSSSSSLSGKWLFGEGGCRWYAFTGFLFGSAHIGTLTLLALDRYLISSSRIGLLRGKLTYRRYTQMLTGAWAYALFWALMPLLGWGRYGLEPSVTTCTIDWQNNDSSYKSFILVYFVLGFVVPFAIITLCYCAIIANNRKTVNESRGRREAWANDSSLTLMSLILIVAFVVAWSPYAVLCLWTVFLPPSTVPSFLTLVPPLFAKSSTAFNPLIYFLANPRLRAAILSTVACCKEAPPQSIELPDSPERAAPPDPIR